MKIIVLMEDSSGHPQCVYEHGLSLYMETAKHKLLMDAGASAQTMENARRLGVDIAGVDMLVLSHGHYDHAGGIPAFCQWNSSARIYMQRTALMDYYHGERYIGIDKGIGALPNIEMLDGDMEVDEEISIFSGIRGRKFWPQSNIGLSCRVDGEERQDGFAHEQCLVVKGEKKILVSGCAHNGILNILDRYEALYGGSPDIVISGFHMMKKSDYTEQESDVIYQMALELVKRDTVFYTGHCTGQKAIDIMRSVMKDKIVPLHCGMEIEWKTR